jgi:hypothetical protein
MDRQGYESLIGRRQHVRRATYSFLTEIEATIKGLFDASGIEPAGSPVPYPSPAAPKVAEELATAKSLTSEIQDQTARVMGLDKALTLAEAAEKSLRKKLVISLVISIAMAGAAAYFYLHH